MFVRHYAYLLSWVEAPGRQQWPRNVLVKSQSQNCLTPLCDLEYKEHLKVFVETANETYSAYLVEHILKLILGECRALNILHCAQVFCHTLAILLSDWLHSLFCKLFADAGIIPEIGLCTNDQARNTWAMVVYFWKPLLTDVLERCGRRHTKAHQEHIGLGVR